jgi:ribosomal protein S18 acetylase RimI-like enzyme
MNNLQDVLLFLKEDYTKNIALINILERGDYDRFKIAGQSVRVRDKKSGSYFFSFNSPANISDLLNTDDLNVFFVNDIDYMTDLQKCLPEATFSVYHAFVMQNAANLNENLLPDGFKFVTPDMSWLDFILKRYRNEEFCQKEYIADLLTNGPAVAIESSGQKIAVVLMHKDGETGPIIVDKAFRRRRLGRALLIAFNRILFEKRIPSFTFVERSNIASISLMLSAGYKKSEKDIIWISSECPVRPLVCNKSYLEG